MGREKLEHNTKKTGTQDEIAKTRPDREFSREIIEHNGCAIELVGVHHLPDTIESVGSEIEEAISHSDIVLAEGAPAAEWLNNDAVFQVAWEYFNQLYPNDPRNASVEELKQNFSQAPGIQFYVAVENMAAEHGKDIIVSDPDDFTDAIVLKLSTLNYRIQLAKSLSGWGGLLLSAAFTYRNKKKALKEGKQDTEVTKTSMSRRSFLTKSLMALSATMLGSREVSRSEFLREDPIARKLVYDIEDYRDTIIAEGLDQLTASLEVGSRVAVIYGGFHMDAVKRYLASNARRKAVNTQYSLTYQKVASPMYRRFHFNQEKQGWETIERRPVFEK